METAILMGLVGIGYLANNSNPVFKARSIANFSVTYPLFFIASIEVPGLARCSTTPNTPPGF